MSDIPQSWKDVLLAMILGSVAWQTPADLADAIGNDPDATTDLLAELETSGWVEVWEQGEGVFVTFSPLGAERLGVRLVEVGPEELPRWGFVGDPEPPPPRAKGVAREARSAELLSVVDSSPDPVLAAEIAEQAANADQCPPGTVPFPRPTLLIGQGLTPWPGPVDGDGAPSPCPACKGETLQPHMYCLYCDRWGLDHHLTQPVNRRPSQRKSPTSSTTPARLRRDQAHPVPNHDRDRRKARHALKMAAREQAARDRRSKKAMKS
jgi:hypothetical protein